MLKLIQGAGALGSASDRLRLALVWLLTCEQAPSEPECAQVEAALTGGRRALNFRVCCWGSLVLRYTSCR